ncbi:uncharacterized protein F4807DRAFT_102786 [Annulohypoxylon truncatum]|uniref:uncharacterized protein n=1 Tax=Annulohypoxylon truncatum TaxID=327061 RepID=UPI0020081FB4|nr:uncharacterized protein F4807DRAFT_102786 [Annulohypoxylon truncatum]KAI1209295.1 hypothetical protein F4807DRAFT_102786 [Annulohypoxylon truncatum]
MATSLAQLGVQYMASTGSCVVDMAAMHSLFDSCSTIHIRVPENQHRIDVHSNMICIKPTQPEPGAYREQYMYPSLQSPTNAPQAPPKQQQQKRPPSMNGPDDNPQGPLPGTKGGDGEIDGPMRPDVPDDGESPSTTAHTYVRPGYTYTSSGASTLTTQVTRLQSSALSPSLSASATTTTAERFFITTSASATPTPSPQEQATHVPVLDTPPSPSAPVERPDVPRPAAPPPPPAPEIIAPPPPPAPEYCGTTYVKMDVTTIQTLDPHDLDLYLNLLGITGIGLDLDHGVGGLVSGLLGGAVDDDETRELHHELEHSYRVRCGVGEMHGFEEGSEWKAEWKGEWKGERGRVTTTKTQTGCLEECEKGAIGKARGGEVKECLGAAFNRGLTSENCKFWTGGKDEFLPVERLRAGEAGEWDLVYL